MSIQSEEQADVANALNNLATVMQHMQDRYDAAQRSNRRLQVALFLTTIIIVTGIGYWASTPVSALVSAVAPRTLLSLDPETAKEERIRLKSLLPPESRAEIEEFEAEIKWVHDYMKVFTDFHAGSAITLFLAKMSSSVEVMPAMYAEIRSMKQEMQTIKAQMLGMNIKMDALPILSDDVREMNNKMSAVPVLATEAQRINRQMTIMSHSMDSTMGRAGSMMPW